VRTLEGGERHPLTSSDEFDDREARFSPNGRSLPSSVGATHRSLRLALDAQMRVAGTPRRVTTTV